MKTEIEKSRVIEINKLHREIGGYLKTTLDNAIRIGELLQEQKDGLKHGAWLPWIKKNLSFSERAVQDYMRFYARRKELKSAGLADLAGARKLLTDPGAGKKAAKKKKKAAPVDSKKLQNIIEVYQELYLEKTGAEAYVAAAQYTIARNLLRRQTEEEITGKLETYFLDDFWFTEKNNYSLKNFIAHFNEIVNEDSNGSGGDKKIKSDGQFINAKKFLCRYWTAATNGENFQSFLSSLKVMREYAESRPELCDEIFDDESDHYSDNSDFIAWQQEADSLFSYIGYSVEKLSECFLDMWVQAERNSGTNGKGKMKKAAIKSLI